MMQTFDATAILPGRAEIFAGLKLPVASRRYDGWLEEGLAVFRDHAQPLALVRQLTVEQFAQILDGEGFNETTTPISSLFPRAEAIALYAATVGRRVSERIGLLFESGEEVRALFLDVIASRAAENLTESLKQSVLARWKAEQAVSPDSRIEAYSPGYCGWHVSGQKRLFEFLVPDEIGITLNESYLMQPLKSVSGALIAGRKEFFLDEDVYPFCAACAHRSCEERKRRME